MVLKFKDLYIKNIYIIDTVNERKGNNWLHFSLLIKTTRLLLVDLDGVPFFHVQYTWCVVLVNWITIEPKTYDLHTEPL